MSPRPRTVVLQRNSRVMRRAIAMVGLLACSGGVACGRAAPPEATDAPAVTASVVLPLGPAAPVDVATGFDSGVAPRIDAWGQTLAIVWRDAAGAARVSVSPDAGRTFTTGTLQAPGESRRALAVAVRPPTDLSRPSNDGLPDSRVEIWCRVGDGAGATIVRSMNGGRSFDAPVPGDTTLSDVFPDGWEPTSATTPTTLALLPPASLRYVGVQKTPRPTAAVDEGLPPLTLDEHGALAILWRERTAAGEARVLRRYAVDWNGADPATPAFDAATTVLTDPDATAPALARVPGGIVVAWGTRGTLRTRRIGLDMTCNPNRVR